MPTEPVQTETEFSPVRVASPPENRAVSLHENRTLATEAAPTAQPKSLAVAPSHKRHWMSHLLKPAIKLFLKSQLESVETLTVDIEAGDRQILSGCIPQVSLAAQRAIYRGLHLSQIAVEGRDIQVNIGQVLRGKPLRLLHPVAVAVDLHLQESDLNRSLDTPLLAGAVADLLAQWLQAAHGVGLQGHLETYPSPQIVLGNDRLTLTAPWRAASGELGTLILTSELRLAGHHRLQFRHPELTYQGSAGEGGEQLPPIVESLADFTLDLGTDVELAVLQIQAGSLHCQGYIWVNP
ncbi:LmeA family phospholipid-binding protein [Trichothermofontia sp.]